MVTGSCPVTRLAVCSLSKPGTCVAVLLLYTSKTSNQGNRSATVGGLAHCTRRHTSSVCTLVMLCSPYTTWNQPQKWLSDATCQLGGVVTSSFEASSIKLVTLAIDPTPNSCKLQKAKQESPETQHLLSQAVSAARAYVFISRHVAISSYW